MSIGDVNAILRAYLAAQTTLTAVVGTQIYCPRVPEGVTLPALAFFTRGGTSNPHIPDLPEPSVQFDCWGATPIAAREVYRKLYDVLQGIQNIKVTVAGTDYYIKSAVEEVTGQDIQDEVYPNYSRVITFFRIMIQAES